MAEVDLKDLDVETNGVPQNNEKNENESQNENTSFMDSVTNYFGKMKGGLEASPPRPHWKEYIWSWIGAFIGIGAVAAFHFNYLEEKHLSFLIGSFGASAVLIYGAPKSPLAQPRNFVGGHLVSATVGCIVRVAIAAYVPQIAAAVAVATAVVCMQMTRTVHPPGGATALIAVVSPPLPWAGFLYILMPVFSGCVVMLIVALLVNNMAESRSYPLFWY